MSLEWMLIRGSGLVAYGLLALATIWGLLTSTKVLGRAVKAKGVTWFHESLGIAALLATVIHMVALSVHDYIEFSWAQILVPGRADWRPIPVAFGVVAFYVLVIVALSFYVKKLIGQTAWLAIHHLSFGLFIAAAAHGLFAGTDVGHPAVVALYAGTTVAVGILLAIRVLQDRAPATSHRAGGRQHTTPARERHVPRSAGVDPAGLRDVAADLRHELVD